MLFDQSLINKEALNTLVATFGICYFLHLFTKLVAEILASIVLPLFHFLIDKFNKKTID